MIANRRQLIRHSLFAGAALALGRSSALAAVPPRIRLGTLVPKGSSYYLQLQAMGEKWRAASGGQVGLTIYPDGVQGGEQEMVRRIRVKQLQAGLFTVVGLRLIDPAVTGLQNLPLMFHDLDDVDFVGDALHPRLEKSLEAKGFVVLFWADAGWVRFFSKTPVRTPEELKRLKVFCWAGEPEQFSLMRTIGLQPVSLEVADIVPGLKTGLIDAVPMPPFPALAAQVDLSAPHMLELNYAPLVGAAVVNKETWDQIPPEMQANFLASAQEAGRIIKRDSRAESIASVAAMQKRGLTVHKPTADQIGEWRLLLEKAYPTIRGKIVPADTFDEVKRLLEQRHAGPKPAAVSKI